MQPIYIDFLNGLDIDELGLTNDEILCAIEASLAIQGRGEAVIEPRTHLIPGGGINGHFNVLRGVLGGDIGYAGVKVVGDFVDNYRKGLPSELAILNLLDPATGGGLDRPARYQRRRRDGALLSAVVELRRFNPRSHCNR